MEEEEAPIGTDGGLCSVVAEEEEEDVSRSFICCVCLDLLYKPIVLPCGHVSCFWCVHMSMSNYRESRCPICRHTYRHFPSICQMLHFLLLKMYPLAYKRRERQILEEESKEMCFSPQLDHYFSGLHAAKGSTSLRESEKPFLAVSDDINSLAVSYSIEDNVPSDLQGTHSGSQLRHSGGTSLSNDHSSSHMGYEISNHLSTADVLCSSCKQLLFRPVVLNCGHVYCETCIIVQGDEAIKCQLCECQHPAHFPKVCLELCTFLENKFPEEYAARRGAVKQRSMQCRAGLMKDGNKGFAPWNWKGKGGLNIHFGVGCDSCGIYPMLGDRYSCKDCVEAIGFDLCGDCYNTRSKLPGRFNQRHTPDHRFEHIKVMNFPNNVVLRLIAAHTEDPGNTDDDEEEEEEGENHEQAVC